MKTNYRDLYIHLSNEELLDIYQNNRGNYIDEVYIEIEKILEERNVPFQKIESKEIEEEESLSTTPKSVTYLPMILGGFSIFLGYQISYAGVDYFDFWDGIIFTIVVRIIFILYTLNLCEDYRLSKPVWILLVIFFGGWAMIAINFNLSYANKPSIQQAQIEDNDSTNFSESGVYTKCPACLKDLKGSKKCVECGLEFD